MRSKIMSLLLISFITSCLPTLVLSQGNQLQHLYPAPPPTKIDANAFLRNGIGVIINGLDDFSRAWGFRADQLNDAAQLGVKSTGWNINQSSNFVVAVSVTSVSQREEDLYAFKIEVHGGSTALNAGDHEALATLGDISAKRILDVRKDDTTLLLSTLSEMVKSVANKMKRELLQKNFRRPLPYDLSPPQDNRQ